MKIKRDSKIYVAGHRGLVGSAIIRQLKKDGYGNLITRTSNELDLTRQGRVENFFRDEKPEYVFLAAAKVGGIYANNTWPGDFIYNNLAIQTNIIHGAYLSGVKKLLFLGSSCIYPRECPQPMKEEDLLSGPLEPTNEPYAIAKIAGIKMCQAYNRQYGTCFISVMPTNLYGPNDNFDLDTSHVLPALIRKIHEAKLASAKEVIIWGTGVPRREFLHVDDLAGAVIFLINKYNGSETINIGTGIDLTICELAEMIVKIVGFKGSLKFDRSKPDGMLKKLLDISKLKALSWKPQISLKQGIMETYMWYINDRT